MPLPPYCLEVILVSGMASLDAVMVNGRGGLQVLFVSFTKGPGAAHLHLIPLGLPRQVKEVIQPGLLGKAVGTPQA